MGVRRSFITPTGPCTCVLKPSRWPAVDRSELTRQSNWYLKGILCASKTFALQNWIAIVEGLAQKKKKKSLVLHAVTSQLPVLGGLDKSSADVCFPVLRRGAAGTERTGQLCCETSPISPLGLQ